MRGGRIDRVIPLPAATSAQRLRWDLAALYGALDETRLAVPLTWSALAKELRCTPSQLTGIKRARFAIGMTLAMRIAQWIGRPAADFVYAAEW